MTTLEPPGVSAHSQLRDCTAYGARHDLDRIVTTHLFLIAPNNSGTTFLRTALATSRQTWNLLGEGRTALGYGGPDPANDRRLTGSNRIPASRPQWLDVLSDPEAYDWPRTRKAWYFQAWAHAPRASVFVTNLHPFIVGELARYFRNARFLFLVRNPYALCEGICRALRRRMQRNQPVAVAGERLETAAALHVAASLEQQRCNMESYGAQGLCFTYETLCAEPERVAHTIRDLVPQIDDLDLRQRLSVKGRYNTVLTDMNARQISRLDAGQVALCNRVFRRHGNVFDHFGYDLL